MNPWLICGGLLLLLVIVAVVWVVWFWRAINRTASAYYEEQAPLTLWQQKKLASDVEWQRMQAEIEQETERHTQEYDDGPLAG